MADAETWTASGVCGFLRDAIVEETWSASGACDGVPRPSEKIP